MRNLLVLVASFLSACSSEPPSQTETHIPPTWSLVTSSGSHGLAVTSTGDIVYAVGFGDGLFADTGGVLLVDADGYVKSEIPLQIPPACEGCSQMMFAPGMPYVAGDTAWVSDVWWNLFRIDLATSEASRVPVVGSDAVPGIAGLDRASAITPDGSRALLAGLHLTVLELASGKVERTVDFGSLVRSIEPLGGDDYLIDLTEPFSEEGRIALWNAATDESLVVDLPWPVVSIAVSEGWAVAALELSIGEYALVEWNRDEMVMVPLSTFSAPPGEIELALIAEERIIAVGSGGIQVGTPAPNILVGSTLLVDADEGPLVVLETSSVRALAFSPDRQSLYVADTGGLKAFTLPRQ